MIKTVFVWEFSSFWRKCLHCSNSLCGIDVITLCLMLLWLQQFISASMTKIYYQLEIVYNLKSAESIRLFFWTFCQGKVQWWFTSFSTLVHVWFLSYVALILTLSMIGVDDLLLFFTSVFQSWTFPPIIMSSEAKLSYIKNSMYPPRPVQLLLQGVQEFSKFWRFHNFALHPLKKPHFLTKMEKLVIFDYLLAM